MDLTNLPDKLSRAVRFYLVNAGVVGAASAYHMFDVRERNFDNGPLVDVLILPGMPTPEFTGDDSYKVHVRVRFNAVAEMAEAASETARLAFSAQIGKVRQALMLSDDGQSFRATMRLINNAAYLMSTPFDGSDAAKTFAANNKDMDDFTVLAWYQDVYGPGSAKDVNWEVVQVFRAQCCESKIEGYT